LALKEPQHSRTAVQIWCCCCNNLGCSWTRSCGPIFSVVCGRQSLPVTLIAFYLTINCLCVCRQQCRRSCNWDDWCG